MQQTDPHIKSEKYGRLGLLTLDRPQALNALTHGMINAIAASLRAWADDADIACVAVRGGTRLLRWRGYSRRPAGNNGG